MGHSTPFEMRLELIARKLCESHLTTEVKKEVKLLLQKNQNHHKDSCINSPYSAEYVVESVTFSFQCHV